MNKIIEAANLEPKDVVLEIGAGLGALTSKIAPKTKKVAAVEKDRGLVKILKETLRGFSNVEIIQGDILNLKIALPKQYKIVANLPYNIAKEVIMRFLEAENPPCLIAVMLQKEVGQRITARPPKMNRLAVFCQFLSKPEITGYVSKKSFWPQPKVDSAILKIKPFLLDKSVNKALFSKIVRAGFSHPRKQLLNNLSEGLILSREQAASWLKKNNIQPSQRAETLTVEDWRNLTQALQQNALQKHPSN